MSAHTDLLSRYNRETKLVCCISHHKCAAICLIVPLNMNNCVVCCLSPSRACFYVEMTTFIQSYLSTNICTFCTIIFKIKYLDLKDTTSTYPQIH